MLYYQEIILIKYIILYQLKPYSGVKYKKYYKKSLRAKKKSPRKGVGPSGFRGAAAGAGGFRTPEGEGGACSGCLFPSPPPREAAPSLASRTVPAKKFFGPFQSLLRGFSGFFFPFLREERVFYALPEGKNGYFGIMIAKAILRALYAGTR